MTRRVKSKPSLYEGWSSMPGQPRLCYLCEKPVRLKGDSVGFRTSEPKQSWHWSCRYGELKQPAIYPRIVL